MLIKFVPAALVAVALSSAAAFAADTMTTGVIKSINASALELTLADGTTYMLPKGFDASAFKVGEKVVISWNMAGTRHMAYEINAAS